MDCSLLVLKIAAGSSPTWALNRGGKVVVFNQFLAISQKQCNIGT